MGPHTFSGELGCRVSKTIRFHARRLARRRAVPGMEAEDYEQDLLADLFHRQERFDPARASFPTFADRVMRHRIGTLLSPTIRHSHERSALSLDTTMVQQEGAEYSLRDLLPDLMAETEHSIALRLDICRFIGSLPTSWRRCCDILLAGSVSHGARSAGLHRSTVHERVKRIRAGAVAQGLAIYIADKPDSFAVPPVSGPHLQGCNIMAAISELPPLRGPITTADFAEWKKRSQPGDGMEYYRGFLAVDADPERSRLARRSREQLEEVTQHALSSAERGLVHLVQRRHGPMDYSYFAVARTPSTSRSGVLRGAVRCDRSQARRSG